MWYCAYITVGNVTVTGNVIVESYQLNMDEKEIQALLMKNDTQAWVDAYSLRAKQSILTTMKKGGCGEAVQRRMYASWRVYAWWMRFKRCAGGTSAGNGTKHDAECPYKLHTSAYGFFFGHLDFAHQTEVKQSDLEGDDYVKTCAYRAAREYDPLKMLAFLYHGDPRNPQCHKRQTKEEQPMPVWVRGALDQQNILETVRSEVGLPAKRAAPVANVPAVASESKRPHREAKTTSARAAKLVK